MQFFQGSDEQIDFENHESLIATLRGYNSNPKFDPATGEFSYTQSISSSSNDTLMSNDVGNYVRLLLDKITLVKNETSSQGGSLTHSNGEYVCQTMLSDIT
jgi:hypothetical protein